MSDGNTFSCSEACLLTLLVELLVKEFISAVFLDSTLEHIVCERCAVTVRFSLFSAPVTVISAPFVVWVPLETTHPSAAG